MFLFLMLLGAAVMDVSVGCGLHSTFSIELVSLTFWELRSQRGVGELIFAKYMYYKYPP